MASGERLTDPSCYNQIADGFDWLVAAGCAVGGPALANSIRGMQVLSSLAIGFIPGVGDAYLLLSSLAGQDLITGTKLTQSERELYAGMAAFSLATMIIGAGVFSQEAVAATRTVEELGQLERFSAELAHGAEEEARAVATVAEEGRAAEGVARDVSDAGAAGRDLGGDSELLRGGGAFPESERLDYTPPGKVIGQAYGGSCVAGCARMVLADAGRDIPEAYIRDAAGVDVKEGGSIRSLPEAFEKLGGPKAAYAEGGTLEDLQRATAGGKPAIVSVVLPGIRHAVVVDAFAETDIGTTVLIRDPLGEGEGDAYQILAETFQSAWTGNYVHFP